jgi:murein DD-endopeptidase MepM/ murein hydrolase activator NlpD
MHKFLQNYPFSDRRIRLVEGFSAYDGNLKDPVGALHRGIDYVFTKGNEFLPFDVFAMHGGKAYRGTSSSWGRFVVIQYKIPQDEVRLDTVYAHLDTVDESIPILEDEGKENQSTGARKEVRSGDWLGRSGTTGATNDLVQLHVELHRKDLKTGEWDKLDPYGAYDRFSSGRYQQPGELLKGLEHYWIKDEPSFAISKKSGLD